jgi:hypothetical protein
MKQSAYKAIRLWKNLLSRFDIKTVRTNWAKLEVPTIPDCSANKLSAFAFA